MTDCHRLVLPRQETLLLLIPSSKDVACYFSRSSPSASPSALQAVSLSVSPSALPGAFMFASFVPLLATWGLYSLLAPCLQGEKIK